MRIREHRRKSDGSFPADHCDLDHSSVFEDLELGHDGCFRKIDKLEPVFFLIKKLFFGENNGFQRWL